MIQLRKRDVVRNGGQEWVVDMVNECRARCVELGNRGHSISISTQVEPEYFVRRMDPVEFSEQTKTKKGTAEMKNKTAKQNSKNTSSKNTKVSKTRASSRKNAPVTQEQAPDGANGDSKGRGRLGGLLGFSVAAVCRTLGKAGLKARQVQGLMDRLEIKVNPHTVHIQTGAGRNGNMSYGKPAELSKEQLAELIAQVPAEEAAKN